MTEDMTDQPTPDWEDQGGGTDGGSQIDPVELGTILTIEDRLVLARSSRTHAENARQNIANEILVATKEVCQKLICEGESTLAKASNLEAKAEQKHLEALSELEQAESTREEAVVYAAKVVAEANQQAGEATERAARLRDEAESYAENIKAEAKKEADLVEAKSSTVLEEADACAEAVKSEAKQQAEEAERHAATVGEAAVAEAEALVSQAKEHAEKMEQEAATILDEADAYSEAVKEEARQQAEEILELARAAAGQEAANIRQQSQDEAHKALAEVESIRTAAQQELEAQQIYAEIARATVESLEVLGQIRAKLAEVSVYSKSDPTSETPEDVPHILEHSGDSNSGHLSDDQLKAWLDCSSATFLLPLRANQ